MNRTARTAAATAAAALLALYAWAVVPVRQDPTPTSTPAYECAVFDAVVAENLITAGHDLTYGSGLWYLDGFYIGSTPYEDVDFRACAPAHVAEVIRQAQP